jgi:hypothetical protein
MAFALWLSEAWKLLNSTCYRLLIVQNLILLYLCCAAHNTSKLCASDKLKLCIKIFSAFLEGGGWQVHSMEVVWDNYFCSSYIWYASVAQLQNKRRLGVDSMKLQFGRINRTKHVKQIFIRIFREKHSLIFLNNNIGSNYFVSSTPVQRKPSHSEPEASTLTVE